jgi:hypothetical protein
VTVDRPGEVQSSLYVVPHAMVQNGWSGVAWGGEAGACATAGMCAKRCSPCGELLACVYADAQQ